MICSFERLLKSSRLLKLARYNSSQLLNPQLENVTRCTK